MTEQASSTGRTIVVTGGAGFIGSNLTEALLARGDCVICIDNFNDYYNPQLKRHNTAAFAGHPGFTLVEADIRDRETILRLFEEMKPTHVAHLAAMAGVRYSIERASLYADVNIQGTINLMDAAREAGVENFVFASTSSIYGATDEIPFREEQSTDYSLAPYPATKKAGEVMGYAYHNLFGLNFTALRFFTVYGPRVRPDMMAFMVMDRILRDEEIPVFENGEMHRDWTFVDDIVGGVVAALDTPLGYEILNLGRGEPVRLGDFVDIIEELVGKQARVKPVPAPASEPPITYASTEKIERLLNYRPTTSIRDGLRKTWEWFQTVPEDIRHR